MVGLGSFTGLRGLVAVILAGLLPAVAPPVLAQQEPASQAGFWQLDRVESHAHDESGNPCYAWTYTGSPDRATTTTRMVCGGTPWSGTFTGAWSRPPDRLIPGDALEMTVRGAVTASHDGITEDGNISMDFDPARCGFVGSGGSVVDMHLDTDPGSRHPDSAEQTGTGIVPGFSPDEPERGLQVRACMTGWETYFIYRWVAEGSAAGTQPAPEQALPLDPETTRAVAVLQYCRPLVAAAAPVLDELAGAIARDRAVLDLWDRGQIEKAAMSVEFAQAVLGNPDASRPVHPGPVLALLNQSIGRQDFLETLSWRCRAEVARIESQFAAAGISEAAYATAHPAEVADALRDHRSVELAQIAASCQRAFDAMNTNKGLFAANPGELRWGTRANQEAGYQEECLRWHQRISDGS